jgi:hypothetical protein
MHPYRALEVPVRVQMANANAHALIPEHRRCLIDRGGGADLVRLTVEHSYS